MKNTPDVDKLASELNAWSDDALGGPSRLEEWLRVMTARSASDLLLVAGLPPSVRVDGTITALPEGPLDGAEIETAVLDAPPVGAARRYQQGDPADASLAVAGLGRFRINLHRERGRAAAAVRALPARPPRTLRVGATAERGAAHEPAVRTGPDWWTDRVWEIDHARGTGRRDQPTRGQAHRDDRRPDRVRASARQERGRAG
ncbi:MAG: hypothetical protein ABGY72_19300 [bacterium]